MRSYAKYLDVSPSTLSRILNGKKSPSYAIAEKLIDKMGLDPKSSKAFMDSVVEEQNSRGLKRKDPNIIKYGATTVESSDLNIDYYKYISEWHYATILELTKVEGFKSNPKWIAKKLGVTQTEVKIAIDRLLDLELLEIKNGKLVKAAAHLRLQDMYTATSSGRRKKQKQLREKSITAIDEQNINKRSMTSMTMSIDPSLIPEAKEMIKEFNEKLCAFFETGSKKEVFAWEVSLFSLQNEEN